MTMAEWKEIQVIFVVVNLLMQRWNPTPPAPPTRPPPPPPPKKKKKKKKNIPKFEPYMYS